MSWRRRSRKHAASFDRTLSILSSSNAPILRQIGPAFLAAFTFGAVPACAPLAQAVALMRDLGSGRLRKLPPDVSLGFVRTTWRRRIDRAVLDRRTFEFCVLAKLRDRLRAGDMWVEGSRRYRAVEQQLIPAPVFAAMRDAGPLPMAVGDTALGWLAERKALLVRRVAEVEAKIAFNTLEDVQLANGRSRISPLRAITPHERKACLPRSTRTCRRSGSPTCSPTWIAGPASPAASPI